MISNWTSDDFGLMWQDPDYCRWIVDTYNSAPDDCTEKLKIAAEWIQENNPEINEGRLMGFGKHRSETMEWVYENEQATQLPHRVTLPSFPSQRPLVQSLNTFAGERIFCYKQIELSRMWVLQVVLHGFTFLILIQNITPNWPITWFSRRLSFSTQPEPEDYTAWVMSKFKLLGTKMFVAISRYTCWI